MAQPVTKTREQLTAEFSDLDERYAAIVQSHSPEQLTKHPAGNGWSAAECVEHVAVTNSLYLDAIESAISASRLPTASHDQPLTTAGWPSAFFLKSVGPQGKTKLKSPGKTRPTAADPQPSLGRLVGTHQRIRNLLNTAPQPDLNRVRFRNPLVPCVRFTVASGLLIMAAHSRRHLLQAERACEMSNFPKSANIVEQEQ